MKTLSEKRILVDEYFAHYTEEDVKQFIKEILEEIERRKKHHMKHFDRYIRETEKYADDEKQVEYSENQAIKEMNINDELNELEEFIKRKAGKELVDNEN